VAYKLIAIPDGLKSLNDWTFLPSNRRATDIPLQYSEYEKPLRSREITPFCVVDGKKYMVLTSVRFMVKLNQLTLPWGSASRRGR
jgi:hypothetical protein